MEITAKLVKVFDEMQISDAFKKREFVVEYSENPKFTEVLKFELIQDKCDAISPFKAGQTIEISFNLKGREWTSPKGEVKYFNTLQAWKISAEGTNDDQNVTSEPTTSNDQTEDEEMPF